jgi:hypothetical protein
MPLLAVSQKLGTTTSDPSLAHVRWHVLTGKAEDRPLFPISAAPPLGVGTGQAEAGGCAPAVRRRWKETAQAEIHPNLSVSCPHLLWVVQDQIQA